MARASPATFRSFISSWMSESAFCANIAPLLLADGERRTTQQEPYTQALSVRKLNVARIASHLNQGFEAGAPEAVAVGQ